MYLSCGKPAEYPSAQGGRDVDSNRSAKTLKRTPPGKRSQADKVLVTPLLWPTV